MQRHALVTYPSPAHPGTTQVHQASKPVLPPVRELSVPHTLNVDGCSDAAYPRDNSRAAAAATTPPPCSGYERVGRLDQAAKFPRSMAELLAPLSLTAALPERARAYMDLLSDASMSPGAMHKHLLHLICRGG